MDGVKVTFADVKQGLSLQPKAAIFPGYNGNDEVYLRVLPASDECASRVEVWYDTNFTFSASDASTLTELVAIAKGLIALASPNPSLNTIINGVEMTSQGINAAVDTERAQGSQEFLLNPIPCPTAPRCYTVTLQVFGNALITDADPRDEREGVQLTLTLSALGKVDTKTFRHDKKSDDPVSISVQAKVGPARADGPFGIYAKLDEACKTNGPGFGGGDSVSLIKIDMVQIIIEDTPCGEGVQPPPPPPPEPPKPPRGGGSQRG
jgi:hypothetical protein